jgi:hypothetical protein
MLFAAFGQHPYGYYTLLRWVVTASAVLIMVIAWQSTSQWAIWPFLVIAILFNPLAPIYMSRESWRPIDILGGLAFLAAAGVLQRKPHPDRPSAG